MPSVIQRCSDSSTTARASRCAGRSGEVVSRRWAGGSPSIRRYSAVSGTSDLTPVVVALQLDAAGARPLTVRSRWTKVASASRPPPWRAGVAVVDNSSHGIACSETVTSLTSVPTTLLPSLACDVGSAEVRDDHPAAAVGQVCARSDERPPEPWPTRYGRLPAGGRSERGDAGSRAWAIWASARTAVSVTRPAANRRGKRMGS
jgi:hypothetical protein